MNSQYVSDLYSKNPIFQSITQFLSENSEVRELTMPHMQKITKATAKEIDTVMRALHQKAAIGTYKIGRKGNPNRFVFEHYPQDISFAAIDPIHTADPISKPPTRQPKPIATINDEGKVVPVTNTRERHLNVSIDARGMHFDISPGMTISPDLMRMLFEQLQGSSVH